MENDELKQAKEQAEEAQSNAKQTTEHVLNLLKGIDDSGNAIGTLFELPEKDFDMVSKIILGQLEDTFANQNTQLEFLQSLSLQGVKAEDAQNLMISYIEELDNEEYKEQFTEKQLSFLRQLLFIILNSLNKTMPLEKRVVNIPIELCHHDARIPVYARLGDAGMDIYAVEDITIKPGETKLIPTGIKCAIPLGYELQVRPRSGLSLKSPLRVANTPGTIDSGYRDEIGVIITNIESPIKNIEQEPVWDAAHKRIEYFQVSAIEYGQSYTITKGMKFAQLVLSEVPTCSFFEVEDVGKIEGNRGGGFGHSGV